MKNIVLIGMPGSGKSTLGKLLGQKLKYNFFDADIVLEKLEGKTIKELFTVGEECFREAETRTLKYLSKLENCIIAAGGGAVKRSENMQLFRKNAIVIFIDRSPENIVQDVDIASRPLLTEGRQKIFDLYRERAELYRRYQDYIVDNNGSQEDALVELLELTRRECL